MPIEIAAVYENGVFKLLNPLLYDLPEGLKVSLTVRIEKPIEDNASEPEPKNHQILVVDSVSDYLPKRKEPVNRQPGSAKGLFQIADDFDEPLEEFEEYMK